MKKLCGACCVVRVCVVRVPGIDPAGIGRTELQTLCIRSCLSFACLSPVSCLSLRISDSSYPVAPNQMLSQLKAGAEEKNDEEGEAKAGVKAKTEEEELAEGKKAMAGQLTSAVTDEKTVKPVVAEDAPPAASNATAANGTDVQPNNSTPPVVAKKR